MERFEIFLPSLHHKIFEFEMKFSEIFPDVFYFTTGNPGISHREQRNQMGTHV